MNKPTRNSWRIRWSRNASVVGWHLGKVSFLDGSARALTALSEGLTPRLDDLVDLAADISSTGADPSDTYLVRFGGAVVGPLGS